MTIYGTGIVRKCLQTAFPVFPMLKNYCSWEWQHLHPDFVQRIGASREATILVKTVPVSRKPPLYALSNKVDEPLEDFWEVGLILQNESTGRSLAYFPTLVNITPEIEAYLRKADIFMVDGTFWSEEELVKMGATERSASNMGHLPISEVGS